jgi:hypothetical protein
MATALSSLSAPTVLPAQHLAPNIPTRNDVATRRSMPATTKPHKQHSNVVSFALSGQYDKHQPVRNKSASRRVIANANPTALAGPD